MMITEEPGDDGLKRLGKTRTDGGER